MSVPHGGRGLFCLVGLVFLIALSSGARGEEITVFTGRTMGPIPYNIRAVLPPGVVAKDIGRKIEDVLDQINQQMSTYIDSELRRFNRWRETDTWREVSEPTAKVVAYALELAEESGGAFDPTVGPLVNLWGFGPDKRPPAVPPDAVIREATSKVGYAKVSARTDPPALRKTEPDVELDLSALAKGYAVDAVATMLDDMGCEAYMVEIGGEVIAKGRKPGGIPWKIGIEQPDSASGLRAVVEMNGFALATSGDYRNYYEREGRRYSHTIDPTTGRPVEHQMATVSIIASTCMEADALATTLMVMGPERGYEWATERQVAALIVYRDRNEYIERRTPQWGQRVKISSPERQAPAETSEKMNLPDNMGLFVIVFLVFGLAILAMAVGTFKGRFIRGSCGGIAGTRDEKGNLRCSLCHDPSPNCTREVADRVDSGHPAGE